METATYAERLTVPWWAWPAALAAAAAGATELAIGSTALRHPLTYLVAGVLVVAGLVALGRIRVEVRDGDLRVDDAHLPVALIAAVEVVAASRRRELLGVDAHPLAFVIQRPWISGGVRIDLDDPEDPTPYWYVSSRHPGRLAAALLAAKDPVRPT